MTPSPVTVTNWPGPDLVAWITLWVAVTTLAAVGVQIGLAWRELKYVAQDLTNNTEQFKEFLRRPTIKASHWPVFQPANDSLTRVVTINVEIWNEGDKVSRDGLVELLVPNANLANPYKDDSQVLRKVNGAQYVPLPQPYKMTLYPNSVRFTVPNNGFRFGVRTDITQMEVLWRIYDDYGQYPQDDWGRWELQPH